MSPQHNMNMPAIEEHLREAIHQLEKIGIMTARLDAEVLLAYTLGVDRSWLHAHNKDVIHPESTQKFKQHIDRRLRREPVAYIVGKKEFYGRKFIVTPDVLIPRPETEILIDLVKMYIHSSDRLLDVGTGSGCVGITLKLEHPALNMTVSDVSDAALNIARKNAHKLGAKPLRFVASDLLDHWLSHQSPKPFDIIVANLPYVDIAWKTSPETEHEPDLALFASDHGLELVKRLLDQSPRLLTHDGYVFLEADPEQHETIIEHAKQNGLVFETVRDYIVVLKRT